jgi:hypothetical protein
VKAGKHRKYFARKNQKNNTNFITKSIVNMGGSISAGTVAQFVWNNHHCASIRFVPDAQSGLNRPLPLRFSGVCPDAIPNIHHTAH